MEKKRAERDALKQKLIIIIVVLIVITSGNVWFIWYRWQSAREQERDKRKLFLNDTTVGEACMYLETTVGKIVKLESFMLEISFQVLG